MNMIKTIPALVIGGLMLAPAPAVAQTALYSTTLSGGINNNTTRVVLASTTNVAVGSALYVMDPGQNIGELMNVKAIPSSGVVTVDRGVSVRTAHISGAYVLIAPRQTAFQGSDPGISQPTCTAATSGYSPWLNATTGAQWYCSATGSWIPHWGTANSQNMSLISGTATASVAGATVIGGPFLKISGTNAITSFTMSAGWHGQGFAVYPTAAFTITATNNICKAATAVADRVLFFVYDNAAGCFSPSY